VLDYLPGVTNTDANTMDTDGDGMNDQNEFNFGSNPLDPNDTASVPVTGFGGMVLIFLLISLLGVAVMQQKKSLML